MLLTLLTVTAAATTQRQCYAFLWIAAGLGWPPWRAMAFEQLRTTTSRMLVDRGSARSSHRTGSAMTDRYGKVITVTVRTATSTVLQPSLLDGLGGGGDDAVGWLAGGAGDGLSMGGSAAGVRHSVAAMAEVSRLVPTRCLGCRCSAHEGSAVLLDGATDALPPPTYYRLAQAPGRHRCRHHPQCIAMAAPAAARPPPPLSAASPRTSGAAQLMLRRLTSCRWGPRRPACGACGFQCSSCQPVCDGAAKKYCLSGKRVRLVPKPKHR